MAATKTLQQTTPQADVQTTDIIPIARGSAPLAHVLISALVTFLQTVFATLTAPSFTGGATVAGGLTVSSGGAAVTGGGTIAGGLTLSGGMGFTGSTVQNVDAATSASIDWSAAEFHTRAISANTTFTFSGITAARAMVSVVDLAISAAAVPTWPASVKWSNGMAPTLGNGRHWLGFMTDDGGTTVAGVLCAFNIS
jgi:hypothetical protein